MTNRTIPCPECAKLVPMYRPGCVRCNGSGTIPDRRSPTAAERAVERIKEWAEKMCGVDCACCQTAGDHILNIIREEEGR